MGVLVLVWFAGLYTIGSTDANVTLITVDHTRLILIASGLLMFGEPFVRRLIELRHGYRPAANQGGDGERGETNNDE
jgi:hypothetical protein